MDDTAAAIRRKNSNEALRMLKNLIACHMAAPDVDAKWDRREEVLDFYCVFVAKVYSLLTLMRKKIGTRFYFRFSICPLALAS